MHTCLVSLLVMVTSLLSGRLVSLIRCLCRPRELILSRALKTFWDATGKLWQNGALAGKFAGVFVSTGTPGGGQETTVINSLSTLAHHGICYVPLGYSGKFKVLGNLDEVRGGKSRLIRSALLGV